MANNRNAFVEEVESVCGIKYKFLSQEEELLVYTGVINSMEILKYFIIDIGGGVQNDILQQKDINRPGYLAV